MEGENEIRGPFVALLAEIDCHEPIGPIHTVVVRQRM